MSLLTQTGLLKQPSGGAALTLTDGTHTVASVGQITVSGGTVGGTTPNATLTVLGSVGVTTETGTTYTLALTDVGGYIEESNVGAITVTIPTNASVAFPVGSVIALEQTGAGAVTIQGAGGVTLNYFSPTSAGSCASAGQFAVIQLVKTATNTWTASGGIA